ncbi:MAG: toll/interleukin-1 receptor domain-containing protein [Clostridia bacterium]
MNKPNTYLDYENRQNSRYYFVSYSHKDKDIVYSILNDLYANNVNFWYDSEFNTGDNWNSKAEDQLCSQHCQGVIIFLSKNSSQSDAVFKEINIINQEKGKKNSFRVIPCLIDYDRINDFFSGSLSNSDFLKKLSAYTQLLEDGNIIAFPCKNVSATVADIVSLSDVDNVKTSETVRIRESKLLSLPIIQQEGETYINCGKYFFNDANYSDILWKLVKKENEFFYFISNYCLDFIRMDEISEFIYKIKNTITNNYVEDVLLISDEFLIQNIGKTFPTNVADVHRQQELRLFWLNCADGRLSLINSNNKLVNRDLNLNNINAGVRLILKINNDKI